jgi:hypothetical protein
MFHLETLSQFSCNHCVAICAFLVPANLLATLQTLTLVGLRRPSLQIHFAAGLASLVAVTMLLHVFAWFAIGVVMAPTFILLALAGVCLSVNAVAVVQPAGLGWLLETSYRSVAAWRMNS